MDTLYPILAQMKTSLEELEAIMTEEVNQLSRGQINPVSLQVLTDNKSQLLSTIHYYDELRRQQEKLFNVESPYKGKLKLFVCWQDISAKVRSTKALNLKVEQLLKGHLQNNQHMQKAVSEAGHIATLYGAGGAKDTLTTRHKYDISI